MEKNIIDRNTEETNIIGLQFQSEIRFVRDRYDVGNNFQLQDCRSFNV